MKTVDLTSHYDADGNYWVRKFGDQALFGMTDFGKEFLGEIKAIHFQVQSGEIIQVDHLVATIESEKALSEIHVPLSGKVVAVNEHLLMRPSEINKDPYGMGWMLQIRQIDEEDWKALIKPNTYEQLVSSFFNK